MFATSFSPVYASLISIKRKAIFVSQALSQFRQLKTAERETSLQRG